MKKILAGVLALSMILIMASCGNEETYSSEENKETTAVTTSQTVENTDEVSDSDMDSIAQTASSSESEINPEDLKYDFKGIASEKYITALSSDKFMIKYSDNKSGMSLTVCIDGKNEYISMEDAGKATTLMSVDDVKYMLSNSQYAKSTSTGLAGIGASQMYAGLGLYKSGEEEVDGKTYKYDEYYQESTGLTTKMLIDDKGELYALESQGELLIVDEFSDDFDSSKIMTIPEGFKEVSEDEIMKSFMGS